MNSISPETMTTEEKISAMESLWNSLCQQNAVESPAWHQTVLDEREQQRLSGDQQAIDWTTAKNLLRTQINEDKDTSSGIR